MKLAEKYKEKPEICNAIGAHHDEIEQTSLLHPSFRSVTPFQAHVPVLAVKSSRHISSDLTTFGAARPLISRRDQDLRHSGRSRTARVIVGADKIDDVETEKLSSEIARRIQDEMTYPGQVKITVIRETRSVSFAK